MITREELARDPWDTYPVYKLDLIEMMDQIERYRIALRKIASKDMQAIAIDALFPRERIRYVEERVEVSDD